MDEYKITALGEARTKWRDLFDRARAAGLWPGTFAMAGGGWREFFAGLPQSYFGVNHELEGPEALQSDDQTGIRVEISDALEDIYGPPEGKWHLPGTDRRTRGKITVTLDVA